MKTEVKDYSFGALFDHIESITEKVTKVQDKLEAISTLTEPPISVKEAAAFLGKNQQTIYVYIRDRSSGFPYHRIKSGKVFMYRSELNVWIRKRNSGNNIGC